jgi:hypothetical protein
MLNLNIPKNLPEPRRLRDRVKNIAPTEHPASQLKRVIESRELKPKIDSFLYTRHHKDGNSRFYQYYVQNSVDKFLDSFLESTENTTKVIVGPAGSGKSASIRNKFGLSVLPSVQEKSLVIPFYFDNLTEKSEAACRSHVTQQLFSAVKHIQKKYDFRFTPQSTVEFIENTKDSLVAYATIEPKALSGSDAFKIIKSVETSHSLGLAISLLKQTLSQLFGTENSIDQVFFVADDLESMIDNEVVSKTVACILSMQTCMENMGDYNKPSVLLTLLSLRPATFEILQNNQDVNAFDIPDVAEQLQPVEILDMFRKRLSVNIEDIEGVNERENWRVAFQIIERICESLAHTHAKFFLGITNYNIRLACKIIDRIISNSHWYEAAGDSDGAAYGAFKLTDNQYSMTQAALVKTVALVDRSLYVPDRKNGISNLFFGAGIFPAILVGPMIARRCMQAKNAYGYAVLEEKALKENLLLAFSQEIVDQVAPEIIRYFVTYGFLRRVEIDEPKLVSQPSLLTAWSHLSRSSILIECYRDSTCIRHYFSDKNSELERASADLGSATFVGAVDFIYSCAEIEQRMIDHAKSRSPMLFSSLYGSGCISTRLLQGLEKSVSSFTQWKKDDLITKEETRQLLKPLKHRVGEIEKSNRELSFG